MTGMGGYETAQKLREKNENAVIAFVSGVVLPEPEHFRVQPYRYLLKSADIDERMRDIGELLLETKRRSRREVAEVVSDGEARRVPVESILYIEKIKRGSRLTVEAGAAGGQEDAAEQRAAGGLVCAAMRAGIRVRAYQLPREPEGCHKDHAERADHEQRGQAGDQQDLQQKIPPELFPVFP